MRGLIAKESVCVVMLYSILKFSYFDSFLN